MISKQGRKGYGNIADVLLYCCKSEKYIFNTIFMPYAQEYMDKYYRYRDTDGRRYWLDNLTGPGGAAKGNPYYEVMGVSPPLAIQRSEDGRTDREGQDQFHEQARQRSPIQALPRRNAGCPTSKHLDGH